MSKKDAKNSFSDLTAQELGAKGRDLRHEMFNLRLQQASAQLDRERAERAAENATVALPPAGK